MNRRQLAIATTVLASLAIPAGVRAGGLLLPGSGATSTSRAGAAIASASDGEALSINPAGLAKASGTTITVSTAIIQYSMEFTRRGTYDQIAGVDQPYEGQPFGTVKNDPDLALGIGSFQPVPVIAIVSDLGGRVKNLHVAAGVYIPNAYPFRDMSNGYEFNGDPSVAPVPTRYDIVTQEGLILFPSIAAAYRLTPKLDVGARLSIGFAEVKNTSALWGVPGNIEEFVDRDALLSVKAKDTLVPAWAIGATFRPTPAIELAATYTAQVNIKATGDASAVNGRGVELMGAPIVIRPVDDEFARCATGGSIEAQKVCVELALPAIATIGARYKLLDGKGDLRGDVELNLGIENWGAERASAFRVVADAQAFIGEPMPGASGIPLRDAEINHGFRDVYTARLGGSYHIPTGDNTIIVRGGVGHDTAAAREGWLRTDMDGAARTTLTIGGAYRTRSWEVNVGGGAILEGSPSNPGECNPASAGEGCGAGGARQPVDDRSGPDPINPIVDAGDQVESPVAQGDYKAHYVLFMLGFSTWF